MSQGQITLAFGLLGRAYVVLITVYLRNTHLRRNEKMYHLYFPAGLLVEPEKVPEVRGRRKHAARIEPESTAEWGKEAGYGGHYSSRFYSRRHTRGYSAHLSALHPC